MESFTAHGGPDRTLSGATEWPPARIRALGSVTDIPTAAQIFGIGRSTAYELILLGRFPVPALKIGRRYRIPVAAILAALNIPDEPASQELPLTDLINPRPSSVDQRRGIRSPTGTAPRPTVLEDP